MVVNIGEGLFLVCPMGRPSVKECQIRGVFF